MRDQSAAVPVLEQAEIEMDQMPVEPGLGIRDHTLADIADEHFLHIGRNALYEEGRNHGTGDQPEHRQILFTIGSISQADAAVAPATSTMQMTARINRPV